MGSERRFISPKESHNYDRRGGNSYSKHEKKLLPYLKPERIPYESGQKSKQLTQNIYRTLPFQFFFHPSAGFYEPGVNLQSIRSVLCNRIMK